MGSYDVNVGRPFGQTGKATSRDACCNNTTIGWNLNVPAEELGPVRKAEGRKIISGRSLADRSSFNL